MQEYRKASHCVYDLKYHIVWITKYRKPILTNPVGKRVRDLLRLICTSLDVEIVQGHISRDHIHIALKKQGRYGATTRQTGNQVGPVWRLSNYSGL